MTGDSGSVSLFFLREARVVVIVCRESKCVGGNLLVQGENRGILYLQEKNSEGRVCLKGKMPHPTPQIKPTERRIGG